MQLTGVSTLTNRPVFKKPLLLGTGYLLAFVVLDLATATFRGQPGVISWHAPGGLSFALLLAFGPAYAPLVFGACLFSAFVIHRLSYPLSVILLGAAGLTLTYTLAAVVLRRVLRLDLRLRRVKDLTLFTLVALLASALLGLAATIGWGTAEGVFLIPQPGALPPAVPAAGVVSLPDLVRNFLTVWFGQARGLIVLTPFLLVHLLPLVERWLVAPTRVSILRIWRWPDRLVLLENIAQASLIAVVLSVGVTWGKQDGFYFFYFLFLPVAWAALRRGLPGAAAAVLAVNLGLEVVAYFWDHPPEQLVRTQSIMLILALTNLYLGVVVSQRRAAETIYRTLVDHSLQGQLIFVGGRVTFANSAAADILGYPVEALLALSPPEVLALIHPDDLSQTVKNIRDRLSAGAESARHEFRIVRPDGQIPWVEMSATLVKHQGVPVAQAALVDISARKAAETQSRRHAEQLAIINEVGRALAETLDLKEVLNQIAQATHKLLPDITTLFISLYDPDKKLLTVVYGMQNGTPIEVSALAPISLQAPGQNIQREVIHTGEPLILGNLPVRLKNVSIRIQPEQAGSESQSALYVPMKAKGKVIGVLQLQSFTANRFTGDEAEWLNLIGNTAAIALQNARLFAESMQRLERIGALNTAAQKLSFNLGLHRLARDITRTCVQGYGVSLAWLGRSESNGLVKRLTHYPEELDYPHHLRVRWDATPEGQGPPGRAIQTGFPVAVADLLNDPACAPWHELAREVGLRSLVALPLISRDKAFGVLILFSETVGAFAPHQVSFFQAYAHQAASALENARLFEETDRHLQQVQALHVIDMAINASVDLNLTLKVVLEQVTIQLNVDAAVVLVYNTRTQILEHAASRGFTTSGIIQTHVRLGEGHAGQAALERQPVMIPDLRENKDILARTRFLEKEHFTFYYAEPLVAKGHLKGVFEVFRRTPLEPSLEWLDFLETIAGQTAIAIDNAELFEGLQRTNLELALAYDTTLEGWSRAMDLRDKEADGHIHRVTDMTIRLAKALGVSDEELVHIRRGALLHDIGKMGVPDQILLKPGPLTEDEWVLVKKHPVYAYEMLASIAYLRPALDIPYCHHERWDGTGYPRGLQGEHIPLAARIFAVVDVWDTMQSDRPYRVRRPAEQVREYIRTQAGAHFDPYVVEIFLKFFANGA